MKTKQTVHPLVYLDLCTLKRPYDRASDEAVRLEALAVAELVGAAEAGVISLAGSSVIDAENERNPDPVRRAGVAALLGGLAKQRAAISDEIATRARDLIANGFPSLDALHVASAEAIGAVYFVTADKRLSAKGKRFSKILRTRMVDPLQMVRVLEGVET